MNTLPEEIKKKMDKKSTGRPKGESTCDFIKMGIVPRKLTRKEARKVINEVMGSGLKDPELRFMLAVFKSISITNQ